MSVNTTEFTEVDMAAGTATSTAAAASTTTQSGVITTEALTTAAGSTYTFTLTNPLITANTVCLVTVGKGTATTGEPVVQFVTPAAGSAVILIRNVSAADAFNGTVKIFYTLFNLA